MYELRFRQVHLDFHTSPDIPGIGGKFDKKEWQERLQKARVNSITCFSLCHHGLSYHPTQIGLMHPQLKFNLLREQIDACHEIGIRVPIYISAGFNQHIVETHPEWCEINKDGIGVQPLNPGFKKLCFNTAYLDYLCAIIRETTELFPDGDGIFLDIILQRQCCCPVCVKSMLAQGLDPEKEEDRRLHDRQVLMEYYKRTTEAARWKNPELPVFHNSGNIRCGDHEILPYFSHLELESLPTGGWGYDHYPLSAAYSRNLGLDFLGMTGKFHRTWGEFGGFKRPEALRYECAAMIANNSKCSIGDQLHPNARLDESTYEIIGEAYREVEACEPWCIGARSVARTAILAEDEVNGLPAGNVGASRFLLEEHIPFDVVDSRMDFSSYRVLIVAASSPLSAELHQKLRDFVRAGGKVVLSGDAPFLKNEDTVTDFNIPAEFGQRSPFCPDFICCAPELGTLIKTPFLVCLPSRRLKVAAGGKSVGEIYDPYFNRTIGHFCSHQHAPFQEEASGFDSGVYNREFLYFAHPVFEIYRDSGMVCFRKYLAAALRAFLGKQQIETENLPSAGRVTLMKQEKENRYVLHALYAPTALRGFTSPLPNRQRNSAPVEVIEELIPLYHTRYTVAMPEKIKAVTLQPEGKMLKFTQSGDQLVFEIGEFTCHAMVELKY